MLRCAFAAMMMVAMVLHLQSSQRCHREVADSQQLVIQATTSWQEVLRDRRRTTSALHGLVATCLGMLQDWAVAKMNGLWCTFPRSRRFRFSSRKIRNSQKRHSFANPFGSL